MLFSPYNLFVNSPLVLLLKISAIKRVVKTYHIVYDLKFSVTKHVVNFHVLLLNFFSNKTCGEKFMYFYTLKSAEKCTELV